MTFDFLYIWFGNETYPVLLKKEDINTNISQVANPLHKTNRL